ncbi:carboxypeptidase-like regulatory domain-containing protein [Hwangdonia lutea]|uniref:Carboxypeptidase-like regulatory domain-containing protein n=1 Tax=Hwangdonia lutea TaxID=3075823 RepID=A0AA97EN70_9FLAO|nr:carboxypeptidase-like regulatory domain-containing protein [Hwangdonia sp. SCSIO 19198]WOD44442.1 carboxypeptidase-like regulatory domain-containing protein [Hwangdonia sp. SCSIO 19198]
MKSKLFLVLFTFFVFQWSQSQNSIHAKLIDSTTQKPIAYATIELNKKSGVISNNNGVFQIYLNKKITAKDSLFINCLGYETKRVAVEKFNDSIIVLRQKSIELDEVLVSNKNYTVDEIIEKTQENLATNYDFEYTKSRLFYRQSDHNNMIKNTIDIKKSTIPEINQKFVDSVLDIMPKNSGNYSELLGDLYENPFAKNGLKLDIIKASNLYDKNNEISFEGLEEKFNTIFKKHVKRDSYFKIKSGIFGTKEEIDSSLFGDTKTDEDIEKTQAFIDEQKKKESERKKNFLKYRKRAIANLETSSFIFEDSHLNFLEKPNRYRFELLDYQFLNGEFVYKITFTPKRKEDFKGVLYINTDDFAIVRVDYENVKNLKNFRLLGISYSEYLKKGTFIYAKNNSDKYALKYAEVESGNKFGIKRPLKIIEKNKHVKGRRKQNEISTDVHFIVSNITKKELVVFENESITETAFNSVTEKAKVKPTYLPKYDPEFWQGYNVMEPNQAIKDFKSIE